MDIFSFSPFCGGEAVTEYVNKYRREGLPPFEYKAPLDLYPSRRSPTGFVASLTWKDSWPFGDRPGVYLIFDENLQLMYVGKASMSRCLGHRLYEYFGEGSECIPKADWVKTARYVINIAVPSELSFEAPALEEFLIRKLQPKYNGVGKKTPTRVPLTSSSLHSASSSRPNT